MALWIPTPRRNMRKRLDGRWEWASGKALGFWLLCDFVEESSLPRGLTLVVPRCLSERAAITAVLAPSGSIFTSLFFLNAHGH